MHIYTYMYIYISFIAHRLEMTWLLGEGVLDLKDSIGYLVPFILGPS